MEAQLKQIAVKALLVCAFTLGISGAVFAGVASGSWSSTRCMTGFTASCTLTKSATASWNRFLPQPTSVIYENDNYTSEKFMSAYVKSSAGTRLSDDCVCWSVDDDYVSIYAGANGYTSLKVRINNYQYPGQYNMKSRGNLYAYYN